uniref:Uncharacterized protein n=1 Tax=Knipowitschia caucasica TaxID=637954 RepID=A0AAV2MKU9_KNICA
MWKEADVWSSGGWSPIVQAYVTHMELGIWRGGGESSLDHSLGLLRSGPRVHGAVPEDRAVTFSQIDASCGDGFLNENNYFG